MDASSRLRLLALVALLALTLLAVPAAAVDDPADGTVVETVEDDGGRPALAETPRDRLGLLLLTALVVGGGLALANGRRQLKGERPQASGEFRWR